jgi:KUP system potassium uptake protein
MMACIGLVLGFRTSSNLAAAYGVSVTTTMVITTLLFYVVARNCWKWSLPVALLVCGVFLIIDLSFYAFPHCLDKKPPSIRWNRSL